MTTTNLRILSDEEVLTMALNDSRYQNDPLVTELTLRLERATKGQGARYNVGKNSQAEHYVRN